MDITNRHSLEELNQAAHKFMEFPVFWLHRIPFAAYFPFGSKKDSAKPKGFAMLQQFTNSGGLIWKSCPAGSCYVIRSLSVDDDPWIFDAQTGHRTTFGLVFSTGTPSIAVRRKPGGVAECKFGTYETFSSD